MKKETAEYYARQFQRCGAIVSARVLLGCVIVVWEDRTRYIYGTEADAMDDLAYAQSLGAAS